MIAKQYISDLVSSLRSSFRLPIRRLAGIAVLVLGSPFSPAYAEKADRDQPTNIVFSQAAIDDLNQTQVFTGDVVYTKGTIIIRADQLTVRQDPENYSNGTATMTQPGKRAYYRQKRDAADEYVEGEANRIDYDEKSDLVRMTGNAVIRRLTGEKLTDQAMGNVIEYHSLTESYTVVGSNNTANSGKTTTPENRGRVTFQPKAKNPETSTNSGSPSINLKNSPNLNIAPAQ